MYSVSRLGESSDPSLQYSSVRRYNVDFRPLHRPPEALIQDGSSNLRLYIVARRNSVSNFQSYMPYDLYNQTREWDAAKEPVHVSEEDIFDRSISSSEADGSSYRASIASPLIANRSPATGGRRFSTVLSEASPHYSVPDAPTDHGDNYAGRTPSPVQQVYHNDDLQPQDEGPAYNDDDISIRMSPKTVAARSPVPRNVSFAKSVMAKSPKPKGKRVLSGSRNIEHLTPTGYSPMGSFGVVYSNGLDSSGSGMPAITSNTLATAERLRRMRSWSTQLGATEASAEPPAEPPVDIKTSKGKSKERPKRSKSKKASMVEIEPHAEEAPQMMIGNVMDDYDYSNLGINYYGDDSHDIGESEAAGPMATSELAIPDDKSNKKRSRTKKGKLSASTVGITGNDIGGPSPSRYGTMHMNTDIALLDNAIEHSTQGLQAEPIEDRGISVAVGSEDFGMDEYSTFADHVNKGRLGLQDGIRTPNRQQRPTRKPVNSAMLLNSWYISYGNENKKKRKNYQHVDPYVHRNPRYPSRTRLPPMQHWNSNLTSDGSSVLFLIGVTSDDKTLVKKAQHASGDVVIMNDDTQSLDNSGSVVRLPVEDLPEASLVLTDSHGYMEMQVIEPSTDNTMAIADVQKGTPQRGSASLAIVTKRLPISDKKQKRSKDLVGTNATTKGAASRRGKTSTKKSSNIKRKREMTVREALEILNTDGEDLMAIDDIDNDREVEKPRSRRQSSYYQEILPHTGGPGRFDTLVPDSVTMQHGVQISYRSFFRVGEVETQVYNGSLFQPMIVNSKCRSSNVIIPVGREVNMGNVKANFICGYLYSGDQVSIRGLGISWQLKQKHTFFLPMFEEWAIQNSSESMDANVALTFVSI